LSLDLATRDRLRELDREKRELERPAKLEAKAGRAEARKAMVKRIGKRAAGQKEPREADLGYLAFLRRLPCIAGLMGAADCKGATQAAHLRFSDASKGRRNPGMQAKPHDRHATPLCAHHHLHDQHVRQEQAFWNGLGIDPGDLSRVLYFTYLQGEDGLAVLRRFTLTTKEPSS
jgi:hypothetical protein